MITKTFHLIEGRDDITLQAFIVEPKENKTRKRKTILIFPGGGYKGCTVGEGSYVARAYVRNGINAFVLNYSVNGAGYFPDQLIEASLAMKFIHEHSEEFNVDEKNIFTLGFSAGGHLCAMHGTMWDSDIIHSKIEMNKKDNKPRGMVLIYPVITSGKYANIWSYKNLLGAERLEDKKLLKMLSLERRVTKKTPTTFIAHCFDDPAVPVQNTLLFINKLAEKKIPFECHITPVGGHGFSLGTIEVGEEKDRGNTTKWHELSVNWINSL